MKQSRCCICAQKAPCNMLACGRASDRRKGTNTVILDFESSFLGLFPTVLFWLSLPELSQVRGDTPLATCWVYSPYCLHMPRGICAFPELCGTTITRDNNQTDLLGKESGSQAGACEMIETWAGKQVGRRDDKSIWEKPQRRWNQTNSRFIELKIKCGDKVDGLTDKAKLD